MALSQKETSEQRKAMSQEDAFAAKSDHLDENVSAKHEERLTKTEARRDREQEQNVRKRQKQVTLNPTYVSYAPSSETRVYLPEPSATQGLTVCWMLNTPPDLQEARDSVNSARNSHLVMSRPSVSPVASSLEREA
jgi:hypothetical protein